MEKQEKKERRLLTDNRMATITKRETSFEGLVDQLENGEDGIYNLITNDKHVIFRPKATITKKDIEEIPPLKQLREAIEFWENKLKTVTGRNAYIIKSTIIEMRKDQYLIKDSWRGTMVAKNLTRNMPVGPQLPSREWIDENGNPAYEGCSLLDPNVCSLILCNYAALKSGSEGKFSGDTWYLMQDFDGIAKKALEPYPMYQKLVEYKISNYSNAEIQEKLNEEFGHTHSLEYISSLWRNKIPKLISSCATDEWLLWYYTTQEYGKWKKCNRCGEIKLVHKRFFSTNTSSKDGFYSLCKCCRNKKQKE